MYLRPYAHNSFTVLWLAGQVELVRAESVCARMEEIVLIALHAMWFGYAGEIYWWEVVPAGRWMAPLFLASFLTSLLGWCKQYSIVTLIHSWCREGINRTCTCRMALKYCISAHS